MSYYAAILLPDGPDTVHYCYSVDEAHAANAAVRVANRLECDVCVVDDRTDKITQVVRFRPVDSGMPLKSVAVPSASEEKVERHYLSNAICNGSTMQAFVAEHSAMGFTITISPHRDLAGIVRDRVNIIAAKYRR